MLTSLGYTADHAESGEQALDKYRAAHTAGAPFDAVILDLTVRGGMGGRETLKRMAEIAPAVKAIVSSGYSDDDILARYKDSGFMAVLTKPYQAEDLGRVLHAVLQNGA
jgi:CheY-like chemotaxis protein